MLSVMTAIGCCASLPKGHEEKFQKKIYKRERRFKYSIFFNIRMFWTLIKKTVVASIWYTKERALLRDATCSGGFRVLGALSVKRSGGTPIGVEGGGGVNIVVFWIKHFNGLLAWGGERCSGSLYWAPIVYESLHPWGPYLAQKLLLRLLYTLFYMLELPYTGPLHWRGPRVRSVRVPLNPPLYTCSRINQINEVSNETKYALLKKIK